MVFAVANDCAFAMLHENINKQAVDDIARISKIVAPPNLRIAGETAKIMQSFLSRQSELDRQMAKARRIIMRSALSHQGVLHSRVAVATARLMQSTLFSQSVLHRQVAEATAHLMQSILSSQSVLNSHISGVQRIAKEVSRTFQNHYSEIFRSLDFVRTIQRHIPKLLPDTFPSIYDTFQKSISQELADHRIKIHNEVFNGIASPPFHCPKIKIDGNRVWIDDEEIKSEDFDEAVESVFFKIDNYVGQKWDNLPRTVRFVLWVIFQIALIVMLQNPNATQFDQQRLGEAVQEAIRTVLSDFRTSEALLDNPSHVDIQAIESAGSITDTTDLSENGEGTSEKWACSPKSDIPKAE